MSNLTLWNQHRFTRKYDGHLFRYLTYADFLTLVGESGLTDKDIAEAQRINAHVLMGDESEDIKAGLATLDKVIQQMPTARLWASCIVDLDEAGAMAYINDTPRTKAQTEELEHMLGILADLSPPKVDVTSMSVVTIFNTTLTGIPWVTVDTMTWQQAQVYLPYLIRIADERKKAQERLNDSINNCRR